MSQSATATRVGEQRLDHREPPSVEGLDVCVRAHGCEIFVDVRLEPVGDNLRLTLEFPFPSNSILGPLISVTAAAAALSFGAICLAPRCRVQGAAGPGVEAQRQLEAVYRIAYDARCMVEGLPLRLAPLLAFGNGTQSPWLAPPPARDGIVLLFSGGLDSTIAAWTLVRAGARVRLLHVAGLNINAVGEEAAARHTARRLGLQLDVLRAEWTGLGTLGRAYAPSIFGRYPQFNSIPFGRDLLLVALGTALASRIGAGSVCLAHEYDIWRREPSLYMGRPVYRTELATEAAGHHINRLLAAVSNGRHQYASPVAPWTKYRLFHTFAREIPDLFELMSFCYWGTWCGQCPKCMTYGLLAAERRLDFPFANPPLAALGEAEDAWGASAKGPMVGSGLREPLGLAAMVALDELLRTGRLPDGPTYDRFRRAHAHVVGDRAAAIRARLLASRSVLLSTHLAEP